MKKQNERISSILRGNHFSDLLYPGEEGDVRQRPGKNLWSRDKNLKPGCETEY